MTAIFIRRWSISFPVRSEQTGGALSVIEHSLPAGLVALPLHAREREAAVYIALDGTLSVQVGDAVHHAAPGMTVAVPQGARHTFWNAGERTARFLEVVTPGGLERYYEAVAASIPRGGQPDVREILSTSERSGLYFEVDSLLDIVERYHVQLA